VAGFDVARRGSVEAQIANISDELAYNAHDLDDGLQAGLITPESLKQLQIWRRVCEQAGWDGTNFDEITRHLLIRELIGIEVDDVLKSTAERLETLQPKSPMDVQQHDTQIVAHSDQLKVLNRALKDFLYQNMYFQFRVMRMATRAQRFIEEIFGSYIQEPRQLPDEYQAQLKEKPIERVVADYIAYMTDRGALLEYRRLFDPLTKP